MNYYYRTSINKIKRMNSIVPQGTADRFSQAAFGLIRINDYQDFRNAADQIIMKWPGCKVWLEWWIFHRSAKKLFKAVSTMPEERSRKLPSSTNAQESMHNLFYLTAEKDQPIITGELNTIRTH
jgi:hypothetical protein